MDELMDMMVDDASASQISDKLKDLLYAKSAERVDAYKSTAANSLFGSDEPEVEDEVEQEDLKEPVNEEVEDEVEQEELTEEEVEDEDLEEPVNEEVEESEEEDKELVDESNQNSGSRNDIGSQKSFFDTIDEK